MWLLLFGVVFSAAGREVLPSAKVREAMVSRMGIEMERLDGEALLLRGARPTDFRGIVRGLAVEARAAGSWRGFLQVFNRLDAAYPSLHAGFFPGGPYESDASTRVRAKVEIFAEWLAPDQVRYVVSRVDPTARYAERDRPRAGDRVVMINGRAVEEWQRENFEFCKFPLRAQCDSVLIENLLRGRLAWAVSDGLTFTLERAGRIWTVPVETEEVSAPNLPAAGPKSHDPTVTVASGCGSEGARYPGFTLSYKGRYACVYESSPDTAILRISSFYYEGGGRIRSVEDEVAALYPWWRVHATWSHLVVDVIDNHGGDAPIDYYQILFHNDFQELSAAFKKIPEMEVTSLRDSLFWGSRAKEIWFQSLRSRGIWSALREGEFAPAVPMFCADESKDCTLGQFPVRAHSFHGRISVLVNEWCVSSCDGFLFTLKEKLGARVRVFGHPQAADTGFARMGLRLAFDFSKPEGFSLEVVSENETPGRGTLVIQTVVATRSLDGSGQALAGRSVSLDGFVPLTLQNAGAWPSEVLQAAFRP